MKNIISVTIKATLPIEDNSLSNVQMASNKLLKVADALQEIGAKFEFDTRVKTIRQSK